MKRQHQSSLAGFLFGLCLLAVYFAVVPIHGCQPFQTKGNATWDVEASKRQQPAAQTPSPSP